jgi:hypothetical protein
MLKWNLELSGYGLDWTGWDTVKWVNIDGHERAT